MAGVVGVGCCCLRLAERLTEACGPGMPGPYWAVKGKQSATGRNPSGAAAPPLFDKGGKGAVCNIIALKLGSTTDTLHENAGRFLLRIFRKPSPLPLHNCAVSLIIYYKCIIRRGVPRCRQNHKNRCWESWEDWDPRPAVICIRC